MHKYVNLSFCFNMVACPDLRLSQTRAMHAYLEIAFKNKLITLNFLLYPLTTISFFKVTSLSKEKLRFTARLQNCTSNCFL